MEQQGLKVHGLVRANHHLANDLLLKAHCQGTARVLQEKDSHGASIAFLRDPQNLTDKGDAMPPLSCLLSVFSSFAREHHAASRQP